MDGIGGFSASDLTRIRKKRVLANTFDRTLKSKGGISSTDLKQFLPDLNTYAEIIHQYPIQTQGAGTSTFSYAPTDDRDVFKYITIPPSTTVIVDVTMPFIVPSDFTLPIGIFDKPLVSCSATFNGVPAAVQSGTTTFSGKNVSLYGVIIPANTQISFTIVYTFGSPVSGDGIIAIGTAAPNP